MFMARNVSVEDVGDGRSTMTSERVERGRNDWHLLHDDDFVLYHEGTPFCWDKSAQDRTGGKFSLAKKL